jgi:hypothetical protein
MSSVARVEGMRASIPVPPLSTHSDSSPSLKTRLRRRRKYSSRILSVTVSDGSSFDADLAADLIAESTLAAVG